MYSYRGKENDCCKAPSPLQYNPIFNSKAIQNLGYQQNTGPKTLTKHRAEHLYKTQGRTLLQNTGLNTFTKHRAEHL